MQSVVPQIVSCADGGEVLVCSRAGGAA